VASDESSPASDEYSHVRPRARNDRG
jgi:hypothetical protein